MSFVVVVIVVLHVSHTLEGVITFSPQLDQQEGGNDNEGDDAGSGGDYNDDDDMWPVDTKVAESPEESRVAGRHTTSTETHTSASVLPMPVVQL